MKVEDKIRREDTEVEEKEEGTEKVDGNIDKKGKRENTKRKGTGKQVEMGNILLMLSSSSCWLGNTKDIAFESFIQTRQGEFE